MYIIYVFSFLAFVILGIQLFVAQMFSSNDMAPKSQQTQWWRTHIRCECRDALREYGLGHLVVWQNERLTLRQGHEWQQQQEHQMEQVLWDERQHEWRQWYHEWQQPVCQEDGTTWAQLKQQLTEDQLADVFAKAAAVVAEPTQTVIRNRAILDKFSRVRNIENTV